MCNTKAKHEAPILMCIRCRATYDPEAISKNAQCLIYGCSEGVLKEYEPEGAVLANLLDRNGIQYSEFHIASDRDRSCYTCVAFTDVYNFGKEAPTPFKTTICEYRKLMAIGIDYNMYEYQKMSPGKRAVQIAQDTARLYEWIWWVIQTTG